MTQSEASDLGMQRVHFITYSKAFVFITVDPGSETKVLKRLREVPEVKESYFMYGVYDIVAKVEADSMDRLKEVINWKVRRLNNIRSTLTTIVIEGK